MNEDSGQSQLLFLSHSGADTEAALTLKHRIEEMPSAREHGLKVWIDKDDLLPGREWQDQLEEIIEKRATAFAVYVGSKGVINWVEREVRLALSRATGKDGNFPFIPILSANSEGSAALPGFARQFQSVRNVENRPEEFQKLVAAVLGGPEAGTLVLETEPFFGLEAIDENRSHLFFGRERETEELLEVLREQRLLMVTGDSGSGKSSLVHARLVLRWRGGALSRAGGQWPTNEIWHVIKVRPRANARRALGEAVYDAAQKLGRSAADCGTFQEWSASEDTEKRRNGLRCGLPSSDTRTLIVVDQFEEVFTQTPPEQRGWFVDLLLALADPHDEAFAIVLTMRRDYYNLCSQFQALFQLLERDQRRCRYLVGRMSNEDLEQIVTKPLELAGVPAGDREGLARAVPKDVGERPGDLALVQFALTQAWRQRKGYGDDLLRSYIGVGRVEGALAGAAEHVYEELGGDKNESEIKAVFIRLVRLGDTGGATRRVAHRREFNDERWRIVQQLAEIKGNRLVLTGGSEEEPTAEISHEALVTQWPRFQRWLQAAAADKRTLDALIDRVANWTVGGRVENRLATGADMEAFERLAKDHSEWLSPDERAFVQASSAAHNTRIRREQRSRTRLRWLTGVSVCAAILAGLLTWYAIEKAQSARESLTQVRITQSRFLASLSQQETAAGNGTNGILIALEALPRNIAKPDRPYTGEAETALFGAVEENRELRDLRGHTEPVTWAMFSPDGSRIVTASRDGTARLWEASGRSLKALRGHTGWVYSAIFSGDGTRIVTASSDKTARVWDTSSGNLLAVLRGHSGAVLSAVFSRDGSRVLTASDDNTARVWDVPSGHSLAVLQGHTDSVVRAAFSPDDKRIVTASRDHTARVWDASSGQTVAILKGHTNTVASPVFSSDSKRIVTASTDNTARVWDAASGNCLAVLQGHTDWVFSARFSPDDTRIVTASKDGSARLWDAASGRPLAVLEGHTGWVYPAVFSPDGTRIVTASQDNTARVWDAVSGHNLAVLEGHTGWVAWVAFSPDSTRIVTASNDGTARVWDAAAVRTLPTQIVLQGDFYFWVGSAAFSPDNKRIVTASADGTVRLWDAASGQNLAAVSLKGLGPSTFATRVGAAFLGVGSVGVASVAFSPDGKRIATAYQDDNVARVWDGALKHCLRLLRGHTGKVNSVAFSRDGKYMVTASDDATARVWDAASGKSVRVLRGHENPVNSATFSPDGSRIVTASNDNTGRVWDMASGRTLLVLQATDWLQSAAFSPDGKRIVTASADHTAQVWDAASGQSLALLQGHTDWVQSAAFSPNSKYIVTASDDDTARLWDAASGHSLILLQGHSNGVFSAAFSPDGKCIVTCSKDHTARIWGGLFPDAQSLIDYAGAAVARHLTPEERHRFFLDVAGTR